jgi:tetratricopeptide (TPR) repeat protein
MEALKEYRASLAICQRLVADNPSVPRFQTLLASVENSVGWLLYKMGHPSEALTVFEPARTIYDALPASRENAGGVRNSLANILTNMTEVLRLSGRPADARDCCDRAISIREELVKVDPATEIYRSGLAESLMRSGQLRQSGGDVAGAVADWRRAVAYYEALPPRQGEVALMEACCHALLSHVAGLTGSEDSVSQGNREAHRAVAILWLAAGEGYRDIDLMRTEAGLAPIRGRFDFQLLVMDMAFPGDPFGAAR